MGMDGPRSIINSTSFEKPEQSHIITVSSSPVHGHPSVAFDPNMSIYLLLLCFRRVLSELVCGFVRTAHIDFSHLLSLSLSAPSEPSNQPQAHALNFLVFTDPWQLIEARGVRMPLLLILSLYCPFLQWQTHLCLFHSHCVFIFFFNSSHFLRNSRSN